MTVSVTSVIAGPFAPNGATTEFGFAFKALSADEVRVFRGPPDTGQLVDTALYSVSIDPDVEGGVVRFAAAPAAGSGAIHIASAPAFTQEAGFSGGETPFTPRSVNRQFDRAAVRSLVLKERSDRALVVPRGESVPPLPAAGARAGKILSFDAAGKPSVAGIDSAVAQFRAGIATDLASSQLAATMAANNAARTNSDRIAAQAARASAEAFSAAVSAGATWPSIAAGLAATAEGGSFWVRIGGAGVIARLYAKTGGSAVLVGELPGTAADVLGRKIAPMQLARTRPPGIRLAHHLYKLRYGLTDQTRILVFGDSLTTNSCGQWAIQRVLGQHYSKEPVYSFSPGSWVDYLGYGIPSMSSATSIGPVAGTTASYRQKYDYNYSFDGSFVEHADGQQSIMGHQISGDTVLIPIVIEPGAGKVKIECSTLQVASPTIGWTTPTDDEIVSAHSLTGGELIIDANGPRGLATVRLEFASINYRSIRITHLAGNAVRTLWPGVQVRTAAAINYYLVGQSSNAWSNTTDASVPLMAGLIRDFAPDIIWLVSDDKAADYQAVLPRLESAIGQSGMANPPAVILERNPFYRNGGFDDLSLAEATDVCWQFAQSRLDWDVLDHMAIVGGYNAAVKAGLEGDGIHYASQISEMGVDAWASARGYFPTQVRATGGTADSRAVFEAMTPRPLTANQIPAILLENGVHDLRNSTWSAIRTGSAADIVPTASKTFMLQTGTVPNSTVVAYINDPSPPFMVGGSGRVIGMIGGLKFRMQFVGGSETGSMHLLLANDRSFNAGYVGGLTGGGFGFVVRNRIVRGICRTQTGLYETPVSFALPVSAWSEFFIVIRKNRTDRFYADLVEWYADGIVTGGSGVTKLGEAFLDWNIAQSPAFRFEMSNGSGGQDYRLTVEPPRLVSMYTESLL